MAWLEKGPGFFNAGNRRKRYQLAIGSAATVISRLYLQPLAGH
jgi:hypothetical protein